MDTHPKYPKHRREDNTLRLFAALAASTALLAAIIWAASQKP